MKPINPEVVKAQIASLLVRFPELQDDEEALALSLDSETDAVTLLTQLVDKHQNAKCNVAALTIHIQELQDRRQMFDRRQKAIKELMFRLMEIAGAERLPLLLATLSIAKGVRSVNVYDEKALPSSYVEVIRTPKLSEIGADLKAGHDIPGAQLTNGAPHLVIRVK